MASCIRESGKKPQDFVEVRYIDDTPMPALRPEEQQRGYVVFRRHWMDLVFPNSIPKRAEIVNKLEVFAARGEYEIVTFGVRTLKELKGLEVKATELVSEGGSRLAAPEVRIVRCTPRLLSAKSGYDMELLYEGGPVMNMPTYLEKTRAFDIEADRTVQYWLTAHAGVDTPAGIYQGDIAITEERGNTHRLNLTVKVFPITLIEPTVTLGFWDFQEPYSGQIGTVAEVYETMHRHGMNAVFTGVGLWHRDPKTNAYDFSESLDVGKDGRVKVTLAGSPLAERMEAAKRAGFRAVSYQPRFGFRGGFVGKAVRKRVNKGTLDRETSQELARVLKRYEGSEHYDLIKKETTSAAERYAPMFSRAYGIIYVDILRNILKEGRARRWPEIFVDPGDERFSHHRKKHQRGEVAADLPLANRELELMKRAGATTIMNQLSPFMQQREWSWFGDYAREAARFVDIAVPIFRPSYTGIPGPINEVVRKVVEGLAEWGVTTYTYNLTIYDMPDLGAARFNSGYFFETLGEGVEGEFDWTFFCPSGDPYNPLDGYDYMWFFPPRKDSGRLGGPALWLAAKREGVDDLRYLQTLDALIQQAQARTDYPDTQQVASAAASMRKRILGSFDFTTYLEEERLMNPRSRWDTLVAAPGIEPVVKGCYRLHNGWDFEDYNRNRQDIAEAIIKLQQALAQ